MRINNYIKALKGLPKLQILAYIDWTYCVLSKKKQGSEIGANNFSLYRHYI